MSSLLLLELAHTFLVKVLKCVGEKLAWLQIQIPSSCLVFLPCLLPLLLQPCCVPWQCVGGCFTGVPFPVVSIRSLDKHVPLHAQPQAHRVVEPSLLAWMERVSGE